MIDYDEFLFDSIYDIYLVCKRLFLFSNKSESDLFFLML